MDTGSHIADVLGRLGLMLDALLLAQLLGVVGPGEVNDGNLEEGIAMDPISF